MQHSEEVLVAGHEYIRGSGLRFREDGSIGRLHPRRRLLRLRADYESLALDEPVEGIDGCVWEAKLAAQYLPEFDKYGLADDEVVLSQHRLEEISAQPARRQRAHDNVGVQRDSQETSRNTSSSVR